jgi:hypothetical protein
MYAGHIGGMRVFRYEVAKEPRNWLAFGQRLD